MTNREMQNLHAQLSRLGDLRGAKIAYAISKNKRLIEQELKHLSRSLEPDQDYLDYDKARKELCEQYANKDESGQPIIKDGQYDIPEDMMEDFKKAHEELAEKHKEAIDRYEEQKREYENLMNEECNVELHTVSMSEVPDNISVDQMDILEPMIDDGP